MRKNIERLIKTEVKAYTLSKETGIPISTTYRILNGIANIDNITLKNAEILNSYYLCLRKSYILQQEGYEKDDNDNYDYTELDAFKILPEYTTPDLDDLRNQVEELRKNLEEGTGFSIVRFLYSEKNTNIRQDFLGRVNYLELEHAHKIIESEIRKLDIGFDDNELNSIYLSNKKQ